MKTLGVLFWILCETIADSFRYPPVPHLTFAQWRRQRLEALAWPTLAAMCKDAQAAVMWGRSVDRLWLDGGSIRGFRAGVKLGWMAWNVDRDGDRVVVCRESYGHVTDAGRARWADQPPQHVNCRCTIPTLAGDIDVLDIHDQVNGEKS